MIRTKWVSIIGVSAVGLVLLGLVGCGESAPSRGMVTGVVTYKGAGVNTGQITFFDEHGFPAFGEIQSDGSYAIMATVGPNIVTLQSRALDVPTTKGGGAPPQQGKSRIPERYERPALSPLRADVQPGSNTCDFELQEEKKPPPPTRPRRK